MARLRCGVAGLGCFGSGEEKVRGGGGGRVLKGKRMSARVRELRQALVIIYLSGKVDIHILNSWFRDAAVWSSELACRRTIKWYWIQWN